MTSIDFIFTLLNWLPVYQFTLTSGWIQVFFKIVKEFLICKEKEIKNIWKDSFVIRKTPGKIIQKSTRNKSDNLKDFIISERVNRIFSWRICLERLTFRNFTNTNIIILKLNKIQTQQKPYFRVNRDDTFGQYFSKQRAALPIRLDLLTYLNFNDNKSSRQDKDFLCSYWDTDVYKPLDQEQRVYGYH